MATGCYSQILDWFGCYMYYIRNFVFLSLFMTILCFCATIYDYFVIIEYYKIILNYRNVQKMEKLQSKETFPKHCRFLYFFYHFRLLLTCCYISRFKTFPFRMDLEVKNLLKIGKSGMKISKALELVANGSHITKTGKSCNLPEQILHD